MLAVISGKREYVAITVGLLVLFLSDFSGDETKAVMLSVHHLLLAWETNLRITYFLRFGRFIFVGGYRRIILVVFFLLSAVQSLCVAWNQP